MQDTDVVMEDAEPQGEPPQTNGEITDSDLDGVPTPGADQAQEVPTMAPEAPLAEEIPTAKGQTVPPYPMAGGRPVPMSPPGFLPKAGPERFTMYSDGADATPVGNAGASSASSNPKPSGVDQQAGPTISL